MTIGKPVCGLIGGLSRAGGQFAGFPSDAGARNRVWLRVWLRVYIRVRIHVRNIIWSPATGRVGHGGN